MSVGTRERYDPGTFCWVELVTTDIAESKRFYGNLFGWHDSHDSGADVVNAVSFTLDGAVVCGMYALPDHLRESGVPPHWNSYVSVENVDDMIARVETHGGETIIAGFNVRNEAREAFIKDPTGAVLGLWEPRSRHGAERVNDTGYFVWSELYTPDVRGASQFYRDVFGWTIQGRPQDPESGYLIARNNGWLSAGILHLGPEHGGAPHWLTYFSVTSCTDTAARAKALGGEVLGGPLDVAIGRIAIVRDPVGAVFALFEGETDD
jgi:predicted enzyme related to lactoylglutathione lyase